MYGLLAILLFGLLSSCSDGIKVSVVENPNAKKATSPNQPDSKGEVQDSNLDPNTLNYPVVMLDASDVCQGITYYDKEGNISQGLRVCDSVEASGNLVPENIKKGVTIGGITGTMESSSPKCSADGELNCTTNSQYPAARVIGLENQVLAGSTVAGVAGTVVLPGASQVLAGIKFGANGAAYSGSLTLPLAQEVRVSNGPFGVGGTGTLPTLADCSIDGAVGCVVVGPGFAATTTTGLAAKIIIGQSVAGIAGSAAAESHGNCTADGDLNCISNASYRAAATSGLAARIISGQTVAGILGTTAAETHNNCASDGGTNCVATAAFTAAATSGLAGKVISGQTVAGISGTAIAESHNNCLVDGETSCIANSAFTAAATSGLAAKIVSGNSVAGVSGTATAESHSNCAADGATGCVATASYTAALTTGLAAKIVSGNTVAGVSGTTPAESHSNCAADGATGCVATASYTAALTTGLAAKIVSGNTVAGVSGTTPAESHSNCAADGATGCVATASYTAAATTSLASKVLSGQTVAGISGNVTLPAAGHVLSGINFGINGTSSSGSLTLPTAANVRTSNGSYGVSGTGTNPTLANCSSDGGVGCVTVGPLYAAAATTGLAAKVVSGQTVAGVAGTAVAESHSNCSADGSTGCVSTSSYTAASTTGLAAKIITGQTVAGISGTAIAESHSNCATAGAVGCVTTALYKPMDLTAAGVNSSSGLTSGNFNSSLVTSANFEFWDASGLRHQIAGNSALNAGNIKSGISFFGLTGGYPSATYPLANNTATTDLSNFVTQLTIDGAFEFFDSQGTRYTGSGDSDLVAGSIANGIVLENLSITGTATAGAAPNEWDIRAGKVVNGVTGKLKANCRNTANSSIYNSVGANAGSAGRTDGDDIDWWDTIDDYNNNTAALPGEMVIGSTGGPAQTADSTCGSEIWLDETQDGACDSAADDCVIRDKVTNLLWTESNPSPGVAPTNPNIPWSSAMDLCYNLNFAGRNKWRAPTQKELAEAAIHGIRAVGYNGAGTKRGTGTNSNNDYFISNVDWPYWSATTVSTNTSHAWNYTLDGLDSLYSGSKSGSVASVICVK